MTFDAGSVTGSLHFDLSEYTHSMIDAESLMQAFPAVVLEFLENPMLAAIEVFKEAAESFADTIADVGDEAQQIGLAAEKAGVSVQWFSEMSNVAKTVGVSTEQLSVGFKFLQRTASDAVQGMSAEASRAFGELGLSTQFLQSHLNDTQGLFQTVQERIQQLPSAAQRTQAAMEILGRSGSDLTPLFEMSRQSMRGLIDEAHKLGAVEDDASTATGQKWATISATISEAWEGIKRKLAEPILDYLGEHMDQIIKMAEGFAGALGNLIPVALDVLKVAVAAVTPVLDVLLVGLDALARVTDAVGITTDLHDDITKASTSLNSLVFGGGAVAAGESGASSSTPPAIPQTSIEAPSIDVGGGVEAPRSSRGASGGAGDSGRGGGQWDGAGGGGIVQASILRVDPAAWSDAADAFRPALFELANALSTVITAAGDPLVASAAAASGTQVNQSQLNAIAQPAVNIQSLNVAGVDANSTADAIARQLAPQIRMAIQQQQRAAQAAASHGKVQRAVSGEDD